MRALRPPTPQSPARHPGVRSDALRHRDWLTGHDPTRLVEVRATSNALTYQQEGARRCIRRRCLRLQHARRLAAVERPHVYAALGQPQSHEKEEAAPVGQKLRPAMAPWPASSRVTAPASRPSPRRARRAEDVGANTMTPSGFHVPPRSAGASASYLGVPACQVDPFQLAAGKKADGAAVGRPERIARASVPASGCAVTRSSGRTQTAAHRPRSRRTPTAGRRARAQREWDRSWVGYDVKARPGRTPVAPRTNRNVGISPMTSSTAARQRHPGHALAHAADGPGTGQSAPGAVSASSISRRASAMSASGAWDPSRGSVAAAVGSTGRVRGRPPVRLSEMIASVSGHRRRRTPACP